MSAARKSIAKAKHKMSKSFNRARTVRNNFSPVWFNLIFIICKGSTRLPFQNRTVQLYFCERSSSNGVFDIDLFGFPFTVIFNPIFRCLRTMKLKACNELFYGFCERAFALDTKTKLFQYHSSILYVHYLYSNASHISIKYNIFQIKYYTFFNFQFDSVWLVLI